MARVLRLAPLRWSLIVCATVVTAGCAGSIGSQTVPTARAPRVSVMPFAVEPGVKHVFVADSAGNDVTIFGKDGKTRRLTGFEESQLLATDAAGNLYVVNTQAQNIEVFAPPYRNTPSFTLNVPGVFPEDVAVAEDGTVAVMGCRASGSQCEKAGIVAFFASVHASSPCAIVPGKEPLWVLIYGAFDAHGTLYVAGLDKIYTTSRLGAIAGECAATQLTVLQANAAIHFAAGVQVDTSGNIAIVDSGGFSHATAIDVFAPPKPGSRRIKLLAQNPLSDSGVVVSFALSKNGSKLFTAEPQVGSVEYAYPQGGHALGRFTPQNADTVEGVAVTPAEQP